jgi:hypothetical protein
VVAGGDVADVLQCKEGRGIMKDLVLRSGEVVDDVEGSGDWVRDGEGIYI